MSRGKHVKGRVPKPAVVDNGDDRSVVTDGDSSLETGGDDSMTKGTLNRRNVLGLAAAGVAGGSVLAEGFSSAALAATTTEPGAVAPAVVTLTDATTIVVDASLGNDFRVTIAASRTMGNPTNPVDGQKIVLLITQGGAGSCTITWGNAYDFSTSLPQPTLSTAVGQTDLLAFIYNAALGRWLFVAFVGQFYAVPKVSKVSPNSGPTTGGTAITITGTGFLPGAQLVIAQGAGLVGAIAATVTSVTPTTITATTGGGAKAGVWGVLVTTPGGTSTANNLGSLFKYTA